MVLQLCKVPLHCIDQEEELLVVFPEIVFEVTLFENKEISSLVGQNIFVVNEILNLIMHRSEKTCD